MCILTKFILFLLMSAFSARIFHRIKDTAILQFAKKASTPYFILFPWFDNQPILGQYRGQEQSLHWKLKLVLSYMQETRTSIHITMFDNYNI